MNTLLVTNVRSILAAAVLAIVAFAPACHAQGTQVKVHIPFAFESGGEHLPAGTYSIMVQPSQHVLLVRGYPASTFVMAQPEEALKATTQGKVVFRKYGERYFLRDVWIGGTAMHFECIQSRAERQVRIAQKDAPTEGAEVALLELPD